MTKGRWMFFHPSFVPIAPEPWLHWEKKLRPVKPEDPPVILLVPDELVTYVEVAPDRKMLPLEKRRCLYFLERDPNNSESVTIVPWCHGLVTPIGPISMDRSKLKIPTKLFQQIGIELLEASNL